VLTRSIHQSINAFVVFHHASHGVSLPSSRTVSPSPSLALCLPHLLSHGVSLTFSRTVCPSHCRARVSPFTDDDVRQGHWLVLLHAHVEPQWLHALVPLLAAAALPPVSSGK
jgi:hypothetical protein